MRSTKKKVDGISSKFPSEEKLRDFRAYQTGFVERTYRSFMFRPRRDTESDVIAYCEAKDSVSGYILKLIKEDMVRHGIIPKTYDEMIDAVDKDDTPVVFKTNEPLELSAHLTFTFAMPSLTPVVILNALENIDFGEDITIKSANDSSDTIKIDVLYKSNRSLTQVVNIIAARVSEKVKKDDEAYAMVFKDKKNIFTKWEAC